MPDIRPPLVAVPAAWAADPHVISCVAGRFAVQPYTPAGLLGSHGDAVTEADGLVITDDAMYTQAWQRAPRLRVIGINGTGVWDAVDVAEATRRGVAICNVSDYASDAVAEHTLGLMLALARRIPRADRAIRDGHWCADGPGIQLRGRILGVVGYGAIGARVARLGSALGMTVVCATRHPPPARSPEPAIRFTDLPTLVGTADVVSLHARLTPETRYLIGPAEIDAMRPGTLLVNTARGGLVHQEHLIAALRTGRLGGAALDVFDGEPLPAGHELTTLPNVVLTPHIAAGTPEAVATSTAECLDNIAKFLAGEPRNVVNPEVLR